MNKQLSAARERGKVGSRRAGERADRVSAGWTERAAALIRYWATPGVKFRIEQVRAADLIDSPPDGRAWGQAVRLAARNGWIKRVGYAPSVSSHYSPKCLWTRA